LAEHRNEYHPLFRFGISSSFKKLEIFTARQLSEVNMETLRLFKSVIVPDKRGHPVPDHIIRFTAKHGFILAPEVFEHYRVDHLIPKIREAIGVGGDEINSAFHKSWAKVAEASIEQLVLEQIVHYFTTYGFETLGVYSSDSVYIPREELDFPDIDLDGIRLTVIHGLTKEEIKDKLLMLLNSGIALKESTAQDCVSVALSVGLTETEISGIKNREAKTMLYDGTGICPSNPVEFLRMAIYASCEKSLVIKSPALIAEIKASKNLRALKLFLAYEKQHGLARLSEIFYRFKPLFLAFRTNDQLKRIINHIRRLAKTNHKPMPEDYLNTITAKIARDDDVWLDDLEAHLSKVNVFRKIRLAYALKYRTGDVESILYKIRNGKGYATDFNFSYQADAAKALEVVTDSIVEDLRQNIEGQTIFIPPYIDYALPATEKQFTGHFPSGTCVNVPHDMMVGVHWRNVGGHRIDLDLSMLAVGQKYGWDASYRSGERDILFSGDMTDAAGSNGASELFYVKKQANNAVLLVLNYYNFNDAVDVPFKIVVGQEQAAAFKTNHIIDPNNILASASVTMTRKQKILGLLISSPDSSKFYFSETDLGNRISSSDTPFVKNTRQYLYDFYTRPIDMRELLLSAGAELVDERDVADIDLSPEVLEKDSFLKLLTLVEAE
jgi:hypothetical protein